MHQGACSPVNVVLLQASILCEEALSEHRAQRREECLIIFCGRWAAADGRHVVLLKGLEHLLCGEGEQNTPRRCSKGVSLKAPGAR